MADQSDAVEWHGHGSAGCIREKHERRERKREKNPRNDPESTDVKGKTRMTLEYLYWQTRT